METGEYAVAHPHNGTSDIDNLFNTYNRCLHIAHLNATFHIYFLFYLCSHISLIELAVNMKSLHNPPPPKYVIGTVKIQYKDVPDISRSALVIWHDTNHTIVLIFVFHSLCGFLKCSIRSVYLQRAHCTVNSKCHISSTYSNKLYQKLLNQS